MKSKNMKYNPLILILIFISDMQKTHCFYIAVFHDKQSPGDRLIGHCDQ